RRDHLALPLLPTRRSSDLSWTKSAFLMMPRSQGVVAVTVAERLLFSSNRAISPKAKKPGMVSTLEGSLGFSAGGGSLDSSRTMADRKSTRLNSSHQIIPYA